MSWLTSGLRCVLLKPLLSLQERHSRPIKVSGPDTDPRYTGIAHRLALLRATIAILDRMGVGSVIVDADPSEVSCKPPPA